MTANLKIMACAGVMLLIMSIPGFAQTGAEADSMFVPASQQETLRDMNRDFKPMLLRTVFSLMLVVGVVYAGAWLLKKGVKSRGRAKALPVRVLGTTLLAPKRSLTLVEVQGRRLLLGVTDGGISLITELDPEEESAAPVPERPAGDFKGLLGSFLKKETT